MATTTGAHLDSRQNIEPKQGSSRPARKFVLFADGTGNAFRTQESNVWRLYQALDRTKADQIAYYIKGVGTADWKPFALLDQATGIGVPSNVRTLYRFLCWNWQPGDEIYIFGFSRGAFTARALAALIGSQGLVPARIGSRTVSDEEMNRNVMAAWRAYRQERVLWRNTLPTVWIARMIRNSLLAIYHWIFCHRSYIKVREGMTLRADVPIKFLGLFDTVDAYAVPIEELRDVIDRAIWPISFQNQTLSPRVELARHALSLDDARASFRPVRLNHTQGDVRVKEIWFAGAHSDIGGGYADGTLSYIPLVWMLDEIGASLRFQPEEINRFKAYQSAIGPMHDSRSGIGAMYRYGPRRIGDDAQTDGGPPIVHSSVIERMHQGCDDYAPITLPATAQVLLPDGRILPLAETNTYREMDALRQIDVTDHERSTASQSFESPPIPNSEMIERVLDTIWWRHVTILVLMGMIALVTAWPWVAPSSVASYFGATFLLLLIDELDWLFGTIFTFIIQVLQSLMPPHAESLLKTASAVTFGRAAELMQTSFVSDYFERWGNIVIYHPFLTTVVVSLLYKAWTLNRSLHNLIEQRARLAWNRSARGTRSIHTGTAMLTIARMGRRYGYPIRLFFKGVLLPNALVVILFTATLLYIFRVTFTFQSIAGNICAETNSPTTVLRDETAQRLFEVSELCWASGLSVNKGQRYRVKIVIQEPWFDRTKMAGTRGFELNYASLIVSLPMRRLYQAGWFVPILRIGERGSVEIPLEAADPTSLDESDRIKYRPLLLENVPQFTNEYSELLTLGPFDPIPDSAIHAANNIWKQSGLAADLVAEFTAPKSGEVFLYVNDAIQPYPFFGPLDRFYRNNRGSARVTLEPVKR